VRAVTKYLVLCDELNNEHKTIFLEADDKEKARGENKILCEL
jgi:hypothetical protein